MLFGSDQDLFHPAFALGEIEEADLTESQRRLILRDNAARLFALPSP